MTPGKSMSRTLCIYKQVEDKLSELSRGSKKDHLSADKARAIMSALSEDPELPPHEAGSTTHYGEARVAGCIKFDLGRGNRLICLKEECGLHMVFLGTHDEADRWLMINRGQGPEHMGVPAAVIEIAEPDRDEEDGGGEQDPEKEPDYDEMLMARLTEKDLRAVFSGLCGERNGEN